jgi:hypothetical protein
MPVIATEIEPHGVTRIFFDCSPADIDPREVVRLARVIEQSEATALPDPERQPRATRDRKSSPDRRPLLARVASILTMRACTIMKRPHRAAPAT